MSSRDAILAALRRAAPPPSPLPDPGPAVVYPDLEKQFTEALTSVAGKLVRVPDLAALNAELGKLEPYATARRIASLVPGAGAPNVDLAALKDPHELEGVDLAILPGEFGVAENGNICVVRREHELAPPFLVAHLRDNALGDEAIVEVVLGLINDQGRVRLQQQ